MAEAVLDSSAILAYLQGEPGGDIAQAALFGSLVSAITFAEVITKLIDNGNSAEDAAFLASQLPCAVAEISRDRAMQAGAIHERTRGRGISMGDRFCLALAEELGLPVLTGDRRWTELGLPIEVRLIR